MGNTTPEWALTRAREVAAQRAELLGNYHTAARIREGSFDANYRVLEIARALAAVEAETREQCAAWHDAEIIRLKTQIEENRAYLARQGLWADSAANRHCEAQILSHEISAATFRTLPAKYGKAKT